jgi:hypothetical protein
MAKFFFELDPDFHQPLFDKSSTFWNFWDKILEKEVYKSQMHFRSWVRNSKLLARLKNHQNSEVHSKWVKLSKSGGAIADASPVSF